MRVLGWCAALCMAGCGEVSCVPLQPPGVLGELGRGYFAYECHGWADPGCESDVPQRVAVGSDFGLSYEPEADEGDEPMIVRPASERFVRDGTALAPARAGTIAYIAVDEAGEAFDLVHLAAEHVVDVHVTIDGLSVHDVVIPLSEVVDIRAAASSGHGELAGVLPHRVSTSDASVVQIAEGEPTHLHVTGLRVGTAEITIEIGGVERRIAVEVAEEPPRRIPPGDEDSTGGESTGDEGTGDESTGDESTGDESTGEAGTSDESTSDAGTSDAGTTDGGAP